jgi:PAS domain S-box-containing protein
MGDAPSYADGPDLRERYHRLVELAPYCILVHDGDLVLMANAAAAELAGARDRRELVGMRIDDFLAPPYLKGYEALLAGEGPAVRAPAVRDTFHRLDGSSIEVEVTAIPFVDRGRPAAHLVIRDITDRLAAQALARQAEERLRQAEKLEAVGLLAGGVAHEVNNMMLVVLGFCELLLIDPRLPVALAEDVHQISNAGDRAARITGQLLSFSRRGIHQPVAVALDEVVRGVEPTLRQLLGGRSTLVTSLACRHRVLVDRGHLDQVLVNLTLNARDAMPQGGQLTITTTEATASGAGAVASPGRYGLLTLTDTGTGMSASTLARIFEPFFTTKPPGAGTGLGLAAVHGLMSQDAGHVTVESTLGKGTTFALYVPLVLDEAPLEESGTAEPGAVPPPNLTGCVVLVVDDEPAVREIASRILERAGYRVRQASDGAVALDLIAQHGAPDAVVTDVMMPGIGGLELARRLGIEHPTLPVVFMSGYSAEDLRLKGAAGLTFTLVEKPFIGAALAAGVAAALASARVRD